MKLQHYDLLLILIKYVLYYKFFPNMVFSYSRLGVLGIISALIIALAIFFLTAESLMASIINPLLSNLVSSTYVDAWQLRNNLSFPAFIINIAMVELKCKFFYCIYVRL